METKEKSVILKYLENAKKNKTQMKVFLESGPNQPKTMLTGKVVDFDEHAIVLDSCLIFMSRVISVTPMS